MLDRFRFGLWDMAVFKPDAPDPPDPYKVAAAQTETNVNTAREQARLAMTGQQTPWGSIQYVKDPSSPSGYRAVTNLTPEQQALMGQSQDLTAQIGGARSGAIGRAQDASENPFDLNAARGSEIADIHRTFLDPQWQRQSDELDAVLANRGIRPGSEAYEREKAMFSDQRQSAYDRAYLDAYSTANNAALQERNLPFMDMAAFGGATSTPMPGFPQAAAAPTPGVAPTDLTGSVNNAYNQQVSQSNAAMGGLYGLGSAAVSGWASAGFPGASAIMAALPFSDRRLKTKINRIDDDPRGWGIYEFEYHPAMEIPGKFVGFMVDEIEPLRPDAIVDLGRGVKGIDYELLAQ